MRERLSFEGSMQEIERRYGRAIQALAQEAPIIEEPIALELTPRTESAGAPDIYRVQCPRCGFTHLSMWPFFNIVHLCEQPGPDGEPRLVIVRWRT